MHATLEQREDGAVHADRSGALTRREFIASSLMAAAAANLDKAAAVEPASERFKRICFIKPFQNLPFDQIADTVAEVGWSGAEVPVRKGGTIEPEAVEDQLPKLKDALAKRNVELSLIATDAENAADPLTRKVLSTAAKLGVRQYRIKHLRYDLKKPIPPQVAEFRAKIRGLAQLNADLKLQGTVQNHSGATYFGAPVWDIWQAIRDLDPKHMAMYFDIGHATIEGGTSWPLQVQLMQPYFGAVSVKDFIWAKSPKPGNGWESKWCPLGEGVVHPQFFHSLEKSSYHGPISQHFEYPVGSGPEMIKLMKHDLAVLTKWLLPG